MIFKKVNIMDELQVLEQSQKILDDRLNQKQIDNETYVKKSQELSNKINELKNKGVYKKSLY